MSRNFTLCAAVLAIAVSLAAGAVLADPIAINAHAGPSPGSKTDKGLTYRTSWYGNSFAGGANWMQLGLEYVLVTKDGRVFITCGWDEAHRESTFYKDGRIVSALKGIRGGAAAVTDKYVFACVRGKKKIGIRRFFLNDTEERRHAKARLQFNKEAPWPGHADATLYMVDAEPYLWRPDLRTREIRRNPAAAQKYLRKPAGIRGMAVHRGRLYVSSNVSHKVYVIDPESMQLRTSFDVRRYPLGMAFSKQGTLWICHEPAEVTEKPDVFGVNGPHEIVEYTSTGKPTGRKITSIPRVKWISFDNNGLMLVPDIMKDQQLKYFDVSGKKPKQVKTFGVKDGLYSEADGLPRGTISPQRLSWLRGAGVDARGNLYIGIQRPSQGGTELLAYTPKGDLRWRLYCAVFSNSTGIDLAAKGTDVYTPTVRYKMDYAKTEPGTEAAMRAYTVDPFRYPDDPRLSNAQGAGPHSGFIRNLNGRQYMFCPKGGSLSILVKENDSEIFRPCFFMTMRSHPRGYPQARPKPADRRKREPARRYMWIDRNDDGRATTDEMVQDKKAHNDWKPWWVDRKGDLWNYLFHHDGTNHIIHFPLQGFTKGGTPLYSWQTEKRIPRPAPFKLPVQAGDNHTERVRKQRAGELSRVIYTPADDTMLLVGANPNTKKFHFHRGAGNLAVMYDNWNSGKRRIRWQINLPHEGRERMVINAVYRAGNLFFAGWGWGGKIHVYDMRNGKDLGVITPGPEVYGQTGALDIGWGLRAFERDNGEIILFNEENWKQKQLMYRIPPQPLINNR